MGKARKYNLFLCTIKLIISLILFCVLPIVTKAASVGETTNFAYTGGIQTFTAPVSGYYELEGWGAQGGSPNTGAERGGYGAYAKGVVFLEKGQVIYVVVGSQPGVARNNSVGGGYNGGGSARTQATADYAGGGGGATHFATKTGLLSSLSGSKASVLLVAAGGGGGYYYPYFKSHGGEAGGITGTLANAGTCGQGRTLYTGRAATQTYAGGSNGCGGNYTGSYGGFGYGHSGTSWQSGGGSGWYGGGSGMAHGGNGGSSYIGNSLLLSRNGITKSMYCYTGCATSSVAGTLTYATSVLSDNSTIKSDTAKAGTGYARVTLLEMTNTDTTLKSLTVENGIFTQQFDPNVHTYDVLINSEITKTTITGVVNQSTTVVEGNGTYDIYPGTTPFILTTTAESGDIGIYTINITRNASSYVYLNDIKINGNSISGFNPTTLNYNLTVDYRDNELEIETVKARTGQTVYLPSNMELKSGVNNYQIISVSEDGNTSVTYNINITKPHSSKLKSITLNGYELSPEFDPDMMEYTVTIMSSAMALNINAVPADEEANVSLKGFGYIKGNTVGTITVTEPNSVTSVYRIIINKENSVEATTYGFQYTGGIQTFTAPTTGYYRLESWGAQGGTANGQRGGYGAYSNGVIFMSKGEMLYVVVGGAGGVARNNRIGGGYNGGGTASTSAAADYAGAGGGATHIATKSGILSSLSNSTDSILVVASGGGGGYYYPLYNSIGADGGGYIGGLTPRGTCSGRTLYYGSAATQSSGANNAACGIGTGYYGTFGQAANYSAWYSGGGGGYYGGSFGFAHGANSGSSYYNDEKLINYRDYTKAMYCYNCSSSNDEKTYTVSTLNVSSTPTSYYAKSGNGYAAITLLEQPSENNYLSSLTVKATNYDNEEIQEKSYTPTFEMGEEDYYVTLDSYETKISLSARLEDAKASMVGIGKYDVPAGTTDYPITVTAESGAIKTYVVHVTRPANDNPLPKDITITGLVPSLCVENYCKITDETNTEVEFDPQIHTYYLTVPSRIKQLYFNVTAGHPYQKVNGEGKVTLANGTEIYTISIESEDGKNTEVYKYVITKDMTGDNDLRLLEILDPVREINFNPDTLEYYTSVDNRYTTFEIGDEIPEDYDKDADFSESHITKILAITDDPKASITYTVPYDFEVGINKINITVTAENGEIKTYILNVYREKNENVYLSDLTVSNGGTKYNIAPTFNKINTGIYYVTVPNEIDNVDINAVPEVNTTVVSGVGNKPLVTTKANVFNIITTAQNGTIETYKISITREKNNNSDLLDIKIKDDNKVYDLNPSFESNIFDYEVEVDEGISKISYVISPLKTTTTYKVLDGNSIKLGNNIKRIMAIAENGSSKIYTVNVIRPASSNNYLLDLSVSDNSKSYDLVRDDKTIGFDKTINEYYVNVPNDVSSINVSGTKEDRLAVLSGTGKYNLAVGNNQIKVNVTSEAGVYNEYIINVVREPSSNAYLKSITTNEGVIVPTFDKVNQEYIVNVENTVSSISITAVPDVSTTKINGNYGYHTMLVHDLPSGTTEYEFVTLAEDNITSITYKIKIVKDKSDNDNISYLLMEEGALDRTFDSNVIVYNTYVPYEITKGTFHIELEDSKASYIINGNENFVVGNNEVVITVTSESGKTKDYTVNVIRQDQTTTNSYLSNILVSDGTLNPKFNKDNQYYEVVVPYTTNRINVTGVLADPLSTLTGNGTYTLNVGKNLAVIKVQTVDGTIRDYQVVMIREKNNDARLSNVSLKDAVLNIAFDKDVYQYETNTTDKTLTFKEIKTFDLNATYEVIGNELNNDEVNEVIIRVTAANGITTKDYKFYVTKSPSNNNNLISLEIEDYSITPEFNKYNTIYYATIPNNVKNININATAEDEQSTVTGTGNYTLAVGENDFTVTVTSESGKNKNYLLIVTKEGSNNNYASMITVNNGTINPLYDKEVSSYSLEVPYEETKLDFTVLLEDENASYQILNNDLKVGSNNVIVRVTAENGDVRDYNFNVTRKEIVSALLKELSIKNYDLNPLFNSYINNYDLLVNNETTSLDISTVTLDKNATVSISGNENFVVGDNTVLIEVTSSNGVDKELYTLNVIRQPYANTFLDYLYTDQGDLTPKYNQSVMEYMINVTYDIDTIELFGETVDGTASITTFGNKLGEPDSSGSLGTYSLNTGENIIKIQITSVSGVKRTYIVKVIRNKNDDNYLTSLTAKVGGTNYELTPAFNPNTNSYNIDLPVTAQSINIQGTLSSDTATVNGFGIYSLKNGNNEIKINVTSESGNVRTYVINVNKEANSNNHLIELIPSVGSLEPDFSYEETNYSINLDSGVTYLSFEVLTEESSATVSGYGKQLVPEGTSTRSIIVSAENGSTRTYTITINKERTDNAFLSNLYVDGYSLLDKDGNKTSFNSNVFEYYLNVPNSKNILLKDEVHAVSSDNNASINKSNNLSLQTVGDNDYYVTVTAPDGFTKQTYIIHVSREKSNVAQITNITPNIGYFTTTFNPNVLNYTWYVPKNVLLNSSSVTAVASDINAEIVKTDNLIVTDNNGVYEVKVISEDGTNSKTYYLDIELDLSVDATLGSLEIDKGYYEPSFDSDVHVYDVYEYVDETNITITAIPSNEYSTVTEGDGLISLTSEITNNVITVTSEAGTVETYTLNIHRTIKRDEGLKDLFLNGLDVNISEGEDGFDDKKCIDNKCILDPSFNTDVISYSIQVPNEYKNLDVYTELMNDQQSVKIKVNDEYVNTYELPVGKTEVLVEVYDGMNKLTRTYKLNVIRNLSNNNYLKSLSIDDYELTEEFDKHIQEYTSYVDQTINEVKVNAIPEDPTSLVDIQGYTYLEDGVSEVTINVSAANGDLRTYIIHVVKFPKNNSYIKNITVSTGKIWDLTPKFNPTTFVYNVTVPSNAETVTVEGYPLATTTVISGTGEFELKTGKNTYNLVGTSFDEKGESASVTVYTVNVFREASKNVDLKQLSVSESNINPEFDKSTVMYEVDIPEDINKLTLTAIPENPSSKVMITGNENLITGKNIISIMVQSEDKTASKTYTLVVNKSASTNTYLSDILVSNDDTIYSLDPTFDKTIKLYDVSVPYDIDKVNIKATAESEAAIITGNGEEYLNCGNNEKTILVTSESGDTTIYKLNIYRSYNLYLSTLVSDIGELNPVFDKKVNEYRIDLLNDQDEITFVALAENNKATVTGSGTYNLHTGENELLFTVKSPDDNTNVYKVIVNRAKDDNNYLKLLNVDGIMTPTFDKMVQEYQIDVRENIKLLNEIIYETESDTSTVEIIGNNDFNKNNNPNKVIVRVTAENGEVRDYILNVMLQSDIYFSNRLSNLIIDNGKLTPDFAPDINNYAVTVSNSVSELNINAVPENERAIVTGDGKVSLSIGRNVIPIIVQAQDGSVNEYDLIVYRSEANDATLQSLSVTGQNFIPIFNKLTENYEMEIGSEFNELEVIAVPTDSGATVKISGNKNLVSGENTIKVVVTAPDKTTTKTYTIKVDKQVSKNNYLSDLNITDYNFTTSFIKTNQGPYIVNVPNTVNSIMVNATPEVNTSTISGDGAQKLVGGKNLVTIKVTAESGDTRDYTIIVNKALSTDSSLKDILLSDESLDPTFDPGTHEYTVKVPEELSQITITGVLNDQSATLLGNGTYDITDDFTVNLVVTAEDGNKTTYKVNIVRDIPASSFLKSLIIKNGELYPDFHKLITSYTILVPNEVRTLDMIYLPEDEKATVQVTGNENFKVGTNKVHIIVTATDGSQTDYEIAVVRQSIASNYLKSLSVDGYIIKPTFDKTNMYYEVVVPEDVNIVKIKATPEDPTSTLTGTGYKSLKVGDNVAYVTVESASGVIRTYQIRINRTASSENYLLTLESDAGTISPSFDKEVNSYTLKVPDKTTKVTLTGTVSENSLVNGLGTYEVEVGTTTRTITVTSQSGEVNTYTITIERGASNNTNLIDLVPSAGVIDPDYSNEVLTYTMDVEDNVNVISFAATPEDKDAKVTTDEILVLNYGENTYHVKVVAEDGITERNIEITINRKKDISSIEATEEKIFIDIDETFDLSYTIEPIDTTYPDVEWTIDDSSIATIDQTGKVTGVKYGSTIARITSKHDSSVNDSVVITVMSKKIISSTYNIYRNDKDTPEEDRTLEYIIGLDVKITVKEFISKLDNEPTMIKVFSTDDIEAIPDAIVGTGFKVQLIYEDTVLDELKIVVRGDLTGDGQINNTDYVKLKNYILKKTTFNEIEMKAGDLTQSNTIVTTDYVKMKNYILKKINSVN